MCGESCRSACRLHVLCIFRQSYLQYYWNNYYLGNTEKFEQDLLKAMNDWGLYFIKYDSNAIFYHYGVNGFVHLNELFLLIV